MKQRDPLKQILINTGEHLIMKLTYFTRLFIR
jgi:hypothetical protein